MADAVGEGRAVEERGGEDVQRQLEAFEETVRGIERRAGREGARAPQLDVHRAVLHANVDLRGRGGVRPSWEFDLAEITLGHRIGAGAFGEGTEDRQPTTCNLRSTPYCLGVRRDRLRRRGGRAPGSAPRAALCG